MLRLVSLPSSRDTVPNAFPSPISMKYALYSLVHRTSYDSLHNPKQTYADECCGLAERVSIHLVLLQRLITVVADESYHQQLFNLYDFELASIKGGVWLLEHLLDLL